MNPRPQKAEWPPNVIKSYGQDLNPSPFTSKVCAFNATLL